jgi:glutamate synthase (ferredoxin)
MHDACGIGFVATADARAERRVADLALEGLARLAHRGAVSADGISGDGSGVLLPTPEAFLTRRAAEAGVEVPAGSAVGAVMVFHWPARDPEGPGDDWRAVVADAAAAEGLRLAGWREVPVVEGALGPRARAGRPEVHQGLLLAPGRLAPAERHRRAWRARRQAEVALAGRPVVIVSHGFDTVVYKALCRADRLADVYPDLAAGDLAVPFAIFHTRFSTNTMPAWSRVQPFRLLCHNGEINTIAGNRNRMRARGDLGTVAAGLLAADELHLLPGFPPDEPDSASLDAAVELAVRAGRDVRHAVAMLIPDAWEGPREMHEIVRDFYRYHACLTEPWDGPAGVCFTDGSLVGAALDRNGLRPLRWQQADDGTVVCASEAGCVPQRGPLRRGRLGPGQMLCVEAGIGVRTDTEVKHHLARRAPYGAWTRDGLLPRSVGAPRGAEQAGEDLPRAEAAFGLSREAIATVLRPMAADAKEPTFSMGDDTPLPPLSSVPRSVFHALRQRFAQVSNPPIDHLREQLVMSLRTCLGPRRGWCTEEPEAAQLIELPSFFCYPDGLEALCDPDRSPFPVATLDATFPAADGPDGLAEAVARLADEAATRVEAGTVLLRVTDAACGPDRAPVPSLLAVGAVHHALVAAGRRERASILVDTGDTHDTHAVACLLGYGADVICPRVALDTVAALADGDELGELDGAAAQAGYRAAVEDGVRKIMAKMGIATVDAYRGAQIFEAVGLAPEVVERCLTGTPGPGGGISFAAIGAEVLEAHRRAFGPEPPRLADPGLVRFRRRGGEYHAHHPEVIEALHALTLDPADLDAATAADRYRRFAAAVEARPPVEPHDLLEVSPLGPPVPVEEVEPVEAILARVSVGAMSHGALSAEAHETLAVAMNRLGAASNCGEGGEDRDRYRTRGSAHDRNSRIKQIASGRFGVTPEYCVFADELNIKMAQGSKPGEGGQLPGHKVTPEIARLRHTQPGVGLISPPPHHDIYSIEDLAQLTYDLKQVNPAAAVSVKLVAEAGIGTIACGVAKCLAEVIQISGANGGTGASPLSSIKHAGMPWEHGLAEAQRALVEDGLRGRVRLRVDGGFLTGRDVLLAAVLGADEYSFGTAALLAEGCIMVRACHRDTCPTGIATQRQHLRAKFAGHPEGVARYFRAVAEDVRSRLAALGARRLDEVIGRVELLRPRPGVDGRLELGDLCRPPSGAGPRRFTGHEPVQRPRSGLDARVLADAFRVLWEGDEAELAYPIGIADRTVGASLGGAIQLEWGDGVPPGRVHVRFTGSAGQSFGAFLADGVTFELVGEANDGVAKGMAGGVLVIRPPDDDAGDPVLAGNAVAYGATGGQLFIAGRVGERCCVRGSGVVAVVEGVGDHACEYLTGGTVVILGPFGHNLAAGMTGGVVHVWDPHGALGTRLNRQLVDARRPDALELAEVRWLVERHARLTGSARAAALLADWDRTAAALWRVAPLDEVARIERAAHGALRAAG